MKRFKLGNSVLPGFGPTLGYTIFYLSLVVLIPLSALVIKASGLTWTEFVATVSTSRVMASYKVTFGAALAAAGVNALFGVLVALGAVNLLILILVAITLIGGGAGVSRAAGGPPDDFGRAPAGWGMNHGPRPDRLAKVLKLTDAQQGKIKAIMDAERAQAKPLLDKVRGYREQLQQAAEATTFDEAAVRGIATSLAQTNTPELPPDFIWRHCSTSSKFVTVSSDRVTPTGSPVHLIRSPSMDQVFEEQLTLVKSLSVSMRQPGPEPSIKALGKGSISAAPIGKQPPRAKHTRVR